MKVNGEAASKTSLGLTCIRSGTVRFLFPLLFALLSPLSVCTLAARDKTAGNVREDKQWSVQVDKVNPADVPIEPSFRAAIYENLLHELAKTKQFKQVFRSGDRTADAVSRLLILKTTVQAYTPGSETKRAVTTVTGATKLNVRIQLFERDGHLVQEHGVSGGVRFIGSNLRATHNLAHSVASILKKSSLPK